MTFLRQRLTISSTNLLKLNIIILSTISGIKKIDSSFKLSNLISKSLCINFIIYLLGAIFIKKYLNFQLSIFKYIKCTIFYYIKFTSYWS